MATLQDCIDQIQDAVGAVSGIRQAPDEPPESMNMFPFAVCYAREGTYAYRPAETMTGLHTIWLEIHVARKNLSRDVQAAMAFAKSVPMAILSAFQNNELPALQTFVEIGYQFGPMEWGGKPTLGFRFMISGVKTQDAVT